MIRQNIIQLLKNMNELYRAGWSTAYITHQMGKTSSWYKDNMRIDEYNLYIQMRDHYTYWRKRTPVNERCPDFFETLNKDLH